MSAKSKSNVTTSPVTDMGFRVLPPDWRFGQALGNLDRSRPTFAVADLDGFLHRKDKNLAVADVAFGAGAGEFFEAFDGSFEKVVVDGNF